MRVVLNRRGQPQTAGMQVNPLAQVGHVLRALVRHARDVIFVDEQNRGVMTVAYRQLLHIDDGTISDAPDAVKPGAALAFQLCWPLGLAPQERVRAKSNGGAACNRQRIETQ